MDSSAVVFLVRKGPCCNSVDGPYPQYGWDSPEEIPENSGKTPEILSERFLEFSSRVRLGCPKPDNSRHAFEASRAFPEFSPPQYGWERFFFQKWFRRGPLRAGHGLPSSTGGISDLKFSDRWRTSDCDTLISCPGQSAEMCWRIFVV